MSVWCRVRGVGIGEKRCSSEQETVRLEKKTFGAYCTQDCEKVFCFGNVGSVAGSDWVAVAENTVVITIEETEEAGVKNALKEGAGDELGRLYFEFAKNVRKGLRGVLALWEGEVSWKEDEM